MNNNYYLKYFSFIVLALICVPTLAQDYKHTIIPKLGAYSIDTASQSTSQKNGSTACLFTNYFCYTPTTPVSLDIDTNASNVVSVEYEYHLKYGMTVGGDTINFRNRYTSPEYNNRSGKIDTTVLIGNFKKYFGVNNKFQPFIGVGLGYALADFSGPITGDAGGVVIQLKLGGLYKIGRYSIYAEYHNLFADDIDGDSHPDSEGDIFGSVDLTGDGYFLGLAISF